METYLILLGIMLLSRIGNNMTVFYAAGALIVLKMFLPVKALEYFGSHGINWGVVVLTCAMLVPIAQGSIGTKEIVGVFKTPVGIFAILIGIAVAVFGGLGTEFISEDPEIVASLMIGTILGVFFFKGIPVGPLIAGGMVYVCLKIFSYITAFLK